MWETLQIKADTERNIQYTVLIYKDRTGCVEATQQVFFGLGQLTKIGTQEASLYLNMFQVMRGATHTVFYPCNCLPFI